TSTPAAASRSSRRSSQRRKTKDEGRKRIAFVLRLSSITRTSYGLASPGNPSRCSTLASLLPRQPGTWGHPEVGCWGESGAIEWPSGRVKRDRYRKGLK